VGDDPQGAERRVKTEDKQGEYVSEDHNDCTSTSLAIGCTEGIRHTHDAGGQDRHGESTRSLCVDIPTNAEAKALALEQISILVERKRGDVKPIPNYSIVILIALVLGFTAGILVAWGLWG